MSGRLSRQATPAFQVRPYNLAINVPVILNLVRRSQFGEKFAVPSSPALPDEVEEAQSEKLAVERYGSDGVIVLQAAEFREVDVHVGDGAIIMDVVNAELAPFLTPKTGVVQEERYPVEGVMYDHGAGRPPRPQDNLTGSAVVLLAARENRQGEHLLNVWNGCGGALASRPLPLRDHGL